MATNPTLRVSQVIVEIVLLNEYDAPIPGGEPRVFTGDMNGTAAHNATAWLAEMQSRLASASESATEEPA